MKKIVVTCFACLLMLILDVNVANAQENEITGSITVFDNMLIGEGVNRSMDSEPDGMCHCGAQREKIWHYKIRTGECSIHNGVDCTFYEKREYHYCTNPNCGDNWYTEWEIYKTEHRA